MKREVIRGLIAIVALAMIGLVASQVYWINSAVEQRTARFNQEVRLAMINATQRLERMEMLHNMKMQEMLEWEAEKQHGQHYFNFQHDTTINTDGGQVTIRVEQSGTNDTTINIDLGEINVSHSNNYADEGVTVERRVMRHKSNSGVVISQEVFNDRVKRKMQHMDNLLGGLFNARFNRSIIERVPYNKLDSIVKGELYARGIETQVDLGVFNLFNQPVMLEESSTKIDFQNLANSRFQVRLFPNDLVQESNFLKLYFPNQRTYVLHSMWGMLSTSAILILVIIGVFWFTITTILRQKKVSEIKNDFINNMTHELKTPIATIGLACEALTDKDLLRSDAMVDNFVGMIRDENRRLGALVEDVLKSAVLDKGNFKLKIQQTDMTKLVSDVVHGMEIQAKNKGGKIDFSTNIDDNIIEVDPMHLTNVVYNLIDNAIKYTPVNPHIIVDLTQVEEGLQIKVKDNGIGISADNQKKIFDKLYRVPTGNVHNVKGFGLGLSYVKAIIDKHQGKIAVQSAPGNGTTIIITIPTNHETAA